MLNIDENISIPIKEFRFSYARSSGPGGQNVNKVNSKVTIHWPIDSNQSVPDAVMERIRKTYQRRINNDNELVIVSQRFRDQGRNVADCMSKLRELILAVVPEPVRRKKKRKPASANRKRLENKRKLSEKKQRRKPID